MRNKRRSRNYRLQQRNKSKLNFTPVIVMLCLSVGCGYAAAKYVVEPAVNYVPQLTAEDEKNETEATQGMEEEAATENAGNKKNGSDDVVEDEADVEQTEKASGYALQFGCYSGAAAAETAKAGIDYTGLQVLEQDGMYKIIGKIYKTKEEAAAALEKLPDTMNAFVAAIY